MSKEQLEEDLGMLRYFWMDKGDMERYVRYEDCIDEFPLIKQAMTNLRLAELTMDAAFDEQERVLRKQ